MPWESVNRITFGHTEVSLVSEKYAFGGTLDAIGMIGNSPIVLDWKCANAIYADRRLGDPVPSTRARPSTRNHSWLIRRPLMRR